MNTKAFGRGGFGGRFSPPFFPIFALFFFKPQYQFVAALFGLVHNDRAALDEAAEKDFPGQRIFQRFAEKTLQGTRAELGVIAFLGQPAPGFGVVGETITSFRFNLSDDTSYEIIYCAEAVKYDCQ